jgi:hypothetical protein
MLYIASSADGNRLNDRPDLSSKGAPDIDKTVTVTQYLTSGHEPQLGQLGLDTKTD